MLRSISRCGVLGAVAILALACAGSAAAAVKPLRSETVIAGTHAGFVEVHADQPFHVYTTNEAATNPTFKVEGGKRFAGVMMRRAAPDWILHPSFTAGRWDPAIFCSGACTTPLDLLSINAGGENAESGPYRIFAAGDYRLYLLTDGAPARVTLHFPQLPAGTTTLTPEVPTRLDARVLPRRDPLPVAHAAIFGETNTFDTDVSVIATTRTYFNAYVADNADVCSYHGQAPPVAFLPTCPGRSGDDPDEIYQPNPYANQTTRLQGWAIGVDYPFFMHAGTWSIGGNWTSAGDAQSVGWAQVWIGHDPSPLKTGSTARRRASRGRP